MRHGVQEISRDWQAPLDFCDLIVQVADDLASLDTADLTFFAEPYPGHWRSIGVNMARALPGLLTVRHSASRACERASSGVHNRLMPNIATVLKAEIVRLARKELRGQIDPLKKSLSASRAEVAALKRKVVDLERQIRHASRVQSEVAAVPEPELLGADDVSRFRFRAGGMVSNRKRLGLSASDFGLLVGASGQSVYAWEQGKARPRGKNLAAIVALRGIGKREVV